MQKSKTALLLGLLLYIPAALGSSNPTLKLAPEDAQVVFIKKNLEVDYSKVYYYDGQTNNNGNLRICLLL